MTKKLILFAQKREAEATIEALKAEPVAGKIREIWSEGAVPVLFEYEHGWIAITNIGCYGAQHIVSSHRFHFDEIWNLGLAGSLNERFDELGKITEIGTVGKFTPLTKTEDVKTEEFLKTILPKITIRPHSISLISSDFPIHDFSLRGSLAKKWDLVDMEGYGIAYAAHHLGKKCRIWKIISDFASPGGRDLIRKNKSKLSEQLAEHIMKVDK